MFAFWVLLASIYPVVSRKARSFRDYTEMIRDIIDSSLNLGFGEIHNVERQAMHLEADLTALKKDTGFESKTDFETGIKKTIEYVRKTIEE